MDVLDYIYLGKENPQTADAFSAMIPEELLEPVKAGELMAIGSALLGCPNGAIVFEPDGERIVIHSIFVDVFDRRNKTGSSLIEKLCGLAKEMGGIYSLDMRIPPDPEEAFLSFLKHTGFDLNIDKGTEILTTLGEMEKIDLPAPKIPVCTGKELDGAILKSFEARLKSEGIYMLKGGLSQEPVLQELSCYAISQGEVAAACVMAKEKRLSLAYLYGSGGAALSAVLYTSRALALQSFSRDTKVFIDAVSESGAKLASRLLNGDMISGKIHAVKSL